MEKIIEKLNELIQLLKDEGISSTNLKESLETSLENYFEEEEEEKLTLVLSFEILISIDKRYSKDFSYDNEETSLRIIFSSINKKDGKPSNNHNL